MTFSVFVWQIQIHFCLTSLIQSPCRAKSEKNFDEHFNSSVMETAINCVIEGHLSVRVTSQYPPFPSALYMKSIKYEWNGSKVKPACRSQDCASDNIFSRIKEIYIFDERILYLERRIIGLTTIQVRQLPSFNRGERNQPTLDSYWFRACLRGILTSAFESPNVVRAQELRNFVKETRDSLF